MVAEHIWKLGFKAAQTGASQSQVCLAKGKFMLFGKASALSLFSLPTLRQKKLILMQEAIATEAPTSASDPAYIK